MLTSGQTAAAADLLFQAWQEGSVIPALPQDIRPATRADGYAIQAELARHSRLKLFGWKIAATSVAGQAHIGVDGPLAGRLLAERVLQDGAVLELGANRMRVAEVEFAFRMATDLPPRTSPYGRHEVMDAVASLHPAIEIPDSRYADFACVGAPQLTADNACAHWFVLGPATTADWRGIDLARHRAAGSVTGAAPVEGSGANVLGDPRTALTWLVNELSGLGITLRGGEVVTTGTCVVPMALQRGVRVGADLGSLGAATIRIS